MGAGLNKIRNRVGFINRKSFNQFIKTESYRRFREKTGLDITYEEYISILKTSNKEIASFILDNELGFKLPNNIGYIAVTKFKQRDTYIVTDWHNTNKYNKIIPNMNLHSFGYMFKFRLFKNQKLRPFRSYFMQAHRAIKRELATKIKSGKQIYLELDNSYFNKKFSIDNIFKYKK